ncbi:hypothetical protein B9W68_19500 [Streptomyces sp. CS227]|uniref:DoxX family protein n=1 Tax=Streptomyces sp. CS227 TaxID=1982763 RepID=UPI000B41575B|nr:DoxX family protein [Streptomyces sp. CS227]OWA06632.1 hypothetical protein B9W68_19500 [Streptomyces sp. CS227]
MAHGTLLEQPGGLGPRRGIRATLRRYALLPLRAFLGITFTYAGLDKLTDPTFLSASGPGSLGELLDNVRSTAGAPFLIDLAQHGPTAFGYALAIGELLVGLATLLGLWARVAATGGALISLVLWLTVSWPTTPYYYGNDLAYLFCWVPLVLAGAPFWSVDSLIRRRKGH